MKKTILSLFVLTAFVAVTIFSSCQKIEQASPVVVTDSLTGTITGQIRADITQQHPVDETEAMEMAPSGTKVFLKIELQELNPQAPAGEFTIYSTTVDASGNYSFTVPTNASGVNVDIITDDFTYDRKVWNFVDTDWVSSTVRTEYNSVEANNVTVLYGQTIVQDLNY